MRYLPAISLIQWIVKHSWEKDRKYIHTFSDSSFPPNLRIVLYGIGYPSLQVINLFFECFCTFTRPSATDENLPVLRSKEWDKEHSLLISLFLLPFLISLFPLLSFFPHSFKLFLDPKLFSIFVPRNRQLGWLNKKSKAIGKALFRIAKESIS